MVSRPRLEVGGIVVAWRVRFEERLSPPKRMKTMTLRQIAKSRLGAD